MTDSDQNHLSTVNLSTGEAKAAFLPSRGGLMTALTLVDARGKAHDLLWMPADFPASGSGWPGGGLPVLFPFAGRVFHEGQPFRYVLDAAQPEPRAMPLHGFGYALPWAVTHQDASTVELELTDSLQTHDLYPFAFRLKVRYELSLSSLQMTLTVEAGAALTGTSKMPIALGLHPYFRAPLTAKGSREECHLEIPATQKLRVTPLGAAGKVQPFPEEAAERASVLTDPLVGNLILGRLTKPEATLVDDAEGVRIKLSWDDSDLLQYVVLWNKAGEDFHCVEPWMGLPDAVHNGQGCRWLAPGEHLTVRLAVSV